MQIPCASLKVGFRIEKLIHLKIVDLVFMRPFVGRFFAHLHESALSVAAIFSWIEAALTPHDCLHQHGIEMMFGCNGAKQAIVRMKPCRAHPFIKRVDRIARSHSEISETCGQRQHYAEDQFEQESYHFGIKSRAPGLPSN